MSVSVAAARRHRGRRCKGLPQEELSVSLPPNTCRLPTATAAAAAAFYTLRSWVQLLVKEGVIEKFVPIDFSDVDTVFDRCLKVRGAEWEGL